VLRMDDCVQLLSFNTARVTQGVLMLQTLPGKAVDLGVMLRLRCAVASALKAHTIACACFLFVSSSWVQVSKLLGIIAPLWSGCVHVAVLRSIVGCQRWITMACEKKLPKSSKKKSCKSRAQWQSFSEHSVLQSKRLTSELLPSEKARTWREPLFASRYEKTCAV